MKNTQLLGRRKHKVQVEPQSYHERSEDGPLLPKIALGDCKTKKPMSQADNKVERLWGTDGEKPNSTPQQQKGERHEKTHKQRLFRPRESDDKSSDDWRPPAWLVSEIA